MPCFWETREPFESIYGDEVKPRSHGFECPWDIQQIIAWLTIIALTVAFYTLHGPLFPWPTSLVACIIGGLGVVGVVILKLSVSLSDNEDDALKDEMLGIEVLEKQEGKIGCVYCRRFVLDTAKHCAVCDKCVPGFDHHCRWLNTCIGQKNYRLFIAFLSATLASMVIQELVAIYHLIRCAVDQDPYKERLDSMYGSSSIPAYLVCLIAVGLYEGLAIAGLTHLFSYHMWLIKTGRTTVQHIKEKRKVKEDRAKRNEEARRQGLPPEETGCCAQQKRRHFKAEVAARTEPIADHHPANGQEMTAVAVPA